MRIDKGIKLFVNVAKRALPAVESSTRRLVPVIGMETKQAFVKTEIPLLGMAKPATLARDVFQSTTKANLGLSIEDKMRILSEKLAIRFSPQDLANPTLRQNIDKYYEVLLTDKKTKFLRHFMDKRQFTFSPEVFSYVGNDVNGCYISRACQRNYPMEVIDFAGRVERRMKAIPQFEPKIVNFGHDQKYGESLIWWYQQTFENSGELNNALRQSKQLSEKAKEVMTFFDSHQRPLGKNTTLIRGTNYSGVQKQGDIIADKGYMSCATKDGFIENVDEAGSPFAKFRDFLIIKTPGNQKIFVPSDYKRYDSMGERILPRGTRLKALEIHPLTDYGEPRGGCGIINGRRAIVCEII